MRYLITFSYDGSSFAGYQRQPNLRTVQEELEKALYKINNNQLTPICASGRTDKGVHALRAKAHFDLDISITLSKLVRALNSYTPPDIHVRDAIIVPGDFHARFLVKEKEYRYYISMGNFQPMLRNYVFYCPYYLNVAAMKKAIKYLKGVHDFRSFVSENKDKSNCVREIIDAKLNYDANQQLLTFIFRGNGFMKYQIRNMVGYLIRVGENKDKPEVIKEVLASKNRNQGFKTAPPEGLYLIDVSY
ncbi:MAG: tRNA pseudouridine(38-40) synthase TruA [Bacilli bacterium]